MYLVDFRISQNSALHSLKTLNIGNIMAKVAILTSGGDAPGMNACLRACVRYAIYKDLDVYGVERGYKGLIDNNLNYMNNRSVSGIVQRGGTILRSARCPEFKEIDFQHQAADTLKAYGIENLIVIGGDGSFRGAKDLSDNCGINVIGIPGTIDNDLAYTDYTLGFDSAVNTVLWAINALRDTMSSHDRVSLLEVMGRNCGDIALYASICGGAEFCLIPEKPYDIEKIASTMKENVEKGKASNMIIIAEGVEGKEKIASKITELTGIGVKYTNFGHIIRGGSPTMADRILATRMAVRAVEVIKERKTNRVIGIKNNEIFDANITDALSMPRKLNEELYKVAGILAL